MAAIGPKDGVMLKLYHNNISVCAQKVRIVLAEKDVPWTNHHLSLARGEQLAVRGADVARCGPAAQAAVSGATDGLTLIARIKKAEAVTAQARPAGLRGRVFSVSCRHGRARLCGGAESGRVRL